MSDPTAGDRTDVFEAKRFQVWVDDGLTGKLYCAYGADRHVRITVESFRAVAAPGGGEAAPREPGDDDPVLCPKCGRGIWTINDKGTWCANGHNILAAAPRGEAGGPSEDAARVEAALWWRTSPDAKGNHAIPADIVQAAWRVADRALRAAAPAPVGEPTEAALRSAYAEGFEMAGGRMHLITPYWEASAAFKGCRAPLGETPGGADGRTEAAASLAFAVEDLLVDVNGVQSPEWWPKVFRVEHALTAYQASVGAAPAASGARETEPDAIGVLRYTVAPRNDKLFGYQIQRVEPSGSLFTLPGFYTAEQAIRIAGEFNASWAAASVPTPVAPPGEEETR